MTWILSLLFRTRRLVCGHCGQELRKGHVCRPGGGS